MVDVKDKYALVTGSSRGVGLWIARGLAGKGCRLILHARTLKATGHIAEELRGQGVGVHQVAADLSDQSAIAELIDQIRGLCGGAPHILYNNAALMTPYRESLVVPAEDYQLCFAVNTIAPIALCDAFLPDMIGRAWGRIVNVTSGIADQPGLMAYSCSKAALDRYVRDLVPRLRNTGVLMNLIDPGWLRTDMGGPDAPSLPDSVLPGALVPVLLDADAESGTLYRAQDYVESRQ